MFRCNYEIAVFFPVLRTWTYCQCKGPISVDDYFFWFMFSLSFCCLHFLYDGLLTFDVSVLNCKRGLGHVLGLNLSVLLLTNFLTLHVNFLREKRYFSGLWVPFTRIYLQFGLALAIKTNNPLVMYEGLDKIKIL